MQVALFNGAVDIANGILITCDDVKVGSDLHTTIPDGVRDVLKIINGEFLGDNIDDLVAGRNICFVLICNQLVNFTLGNFFTVVVSNNVSAGLQTFNMMACNADRSSAPRAR